MQQDKIFLIKMNNFSVSLQRILMQKGTIPMRICLWLLRFPLFPATNTTKRKQQKKQQKKVMRNIINLNTNCIICMNL